MYRPEGWSNPYNKYGIDMSPPDKIECESFEDGATAMLESLLSKGIHAEEGEWITVRGGILEDDDSLPVSGTWVFIPDEK
jgi:hypothetical protein